MMLRDTGLQDSYTYVRLRLFFPIEGEEGGGEGEEGGEGRSSETRICSLRGNFSHKLSFVTTSKHAFWSNFGQIGIRRIAVRETCVSRHHWVLIESPLNPTDHFRSIVLRGLIGALNWASITPTDVFLSDSGCIFFSSLQLRDPLLAVSSEFA